jgi:hypothetical protein
MAPSFPHHTAALDPPRTRKTLEVAVSPCFGAESSARVLEYPCSLTLPAEEFPELAEDCRMMSPDQEVVVSFLRFIVSKPERACNTSVVGFDRWLSRAGRRGFDTM